MLKKLRENAVHELFDERACRGHIDLGLLGQEQADMALKEADEARSKLLFLPPHVAMVPHRMPEERLDDGVDLVPVFHLRQMSLALYGRECRREREAHEILVVFCELEEQYCQALKIHVYILVIIRSLLHSQDKRRIIRVINRIEETPLAAIIMVERRLRDVACVANDTDADGIVSMRGKESDRLAQDFFWIVHVCNIPYGIIKVNTLLFSRTRRLGCWFLHRNSPLRDHSNSNASAQNERGPRFSSRPLFNDAILQEFLTGQLPFNTILNSPRAAIRLFLH